MPLHTIFGSSQARVLDVMLTVDDRLSVRHVADLAGTSPPTASEALKRLEAVGLVTREDVGAAHTYALNGDHYLVPALRELVERARYDDEIVVDAIAGGAPPGPGPESVIMFGSTSRDEATPDSDLDILVVVGHVDHLDGWREQRPVIEDRLTKTLGRTVQLTLATRPRHGESETSFWKEIRREGRALSGKTMEQVLRGD